MYCKNCGSEVSETQDFCLSCGAATKKNVNNQTKANSLNPNDQGGFGWGLLGFCVPIAGLILFLVWKDTQPKNARAVGIGALVMVIMYFALIVIYVIMFIIIGIAAANSPDFYTALF